MPRLRGANLEPNSIDPDLVLVSAGFDWHRNDLGGNVKDNGFAMLTAIVQQVADQHCSGRLAFVLEGGYDLESCQTAFMQY